MSGSEGTVAIAGVIPGKVQPAKLIQLDALPPPSLLGLLLPPPPFLLLLLLSLLASELSRRHCTGDVACATSQCSKASIARMAMETPTVWQFMYKNAGQHEEEFNGALGFPVFSQRGKKKLLVHTKATAA